MTFGPSKLITQDKLPELKQHIANAKQMKIEQALAMQAGLGNPADTEKIDNALAKLQKIKAVYFPND